MILSRPDQLPYIPRKIVSLVPSQTALLHHLGLEKEVIGITKFCIHPEEWRSGKPIIGGTKNIHIEKILALEPDLVIANKEENIREQVEILAEKMPVWVTDVNDLPGALQMISDLGILTGKTDEANLLTGSIQDRFNQLNNSIPIPAAYLIWRNPYMTVGNDTFIHDMLRRSGFSNVFGHLTRYPEIDIEALKNSGCKVILLSSEPYPFSEKHIDEIAQHLPEVKIMLADGELFSWYGSHLLESPDYFKKLYIECLNT
jgi:ABC-type Fe3+-hydroxamate transport system substrate-binding protein